jgi:hypothetical protein
MPECINREPELYPLHGAEVRCLLYVEQLKDAV